MSYKLVATGHKAKEQVLSDKPLTLGRSPSLHVHDSAVSRKACDVTVEGAAVEVLAYKTVFIQRTEPKRLEYLKQGLKTQVRCQQC